MASEQRFGYEWGRYANLDPNYEKQFQNWIYPLKLDFFNGKAVLDAGCGMGRNSYWALTYGSKRLVAFDHDQRSVAAAKRNLAGFSEAEVLYRSIYDINWQNEFDAAFSIGVIHHLDNPNLALDNLVRSLKPGGTLFLWVYSREGNEWIPRLVDPIRKHITSRLPVPIVHSLAYLCSVPLWIAVKLFKNRNSYLMQLSQFKFWHIHSIAFDQLIPTVANYWTHEEVKRLVDRLPVKTVQIHQPPNKNGWTVIATKK